jgi:PhnB protein
MCLSVEDPGEAERIFQGLSENGKITMPMGETFWTIRFGMLVDQFGIPWMVNCERKACIIAACDAIYRGCRA